MEAAHRMVVWPERRGAGKGAPVFGAAQRTLACEHRSGISVQPRWAALAGSQILLVGLERSCFGTAGLMTASALARRLITLICAGRNRMAMIRRELPRPEYAGWVRKPCRTVFLEGSPFRGPSAVIGTAVRKNLITD